MKASPPGSDDYDRLAAVYKNLYNLFMPFNINNPARGWATFRFFSPSLPVGRVGQRSVAGVSHFAAWQ